MNLKALFNFNYFKENLKKSKGLLAFFFGVVPLLNIVMLVTQDKFIATFNEISSITIIGLYIVPIVLAISLMGFVFSKKSTDFVMSKPINRKTIYLTNLIGGIITLVLLILLNTLIFGLIALLFSSAIIPFQLLIDYFLYWSISYIFVFAVAMLGITIAGNSIGAFVLMFLIICLVPFFSFAKIIFNDFYYKDNYIKCTDNACKPEKYNCYADPQCKQELEKGNYVLQYKETFGNSFTAPLNFLNAELDTVYNQSSMLKMTILSVIYFIIGFYTFKRRKMENNEISFHSELMHYFIKSLVFIPVCFVCYIIIHEGNSGNFLIALVGALIYYIVYDLITRKSIFKLRKSLVICIATFSILVGAYSLYNTSTKNNSIYLDKIDSISFYHNGEYLNIKDEKIIHEIIKATTNNDMFTNARMATFTSNNKYYTTNINFTESLENIINEFLYKRNIILAANFKYNSIDITSKDIEITKKFKNLVKETMNYIKLDDLKNAKKTISVYDYHNHTYQRLIVPYTLNEKLDKYILIEFNNKAIAKLTEETVSNISISCDVFSAEDSYVFEYVIKNNLSSFINYLKYDNINTVKDRNCYIGGSIYLEIADANSFYEEFKKYRKNLENYKEYQLKIQEYQKEKEQYQDYTYEY